jgi:hypothetical protein
MHGVKWLHGVAIYCSHLLINIFIYLEDSDKKPMRIDLEKRPNDVLANTRSLLSGLHSQLSAINAFTMWLMTDYKEKRAHEIWIRNRKTVQ